MEQSREKPLLPDQAEEEHQKKSASQDKGGLENQPEKLQEGQRVKDKAVDLGENILKHSETEPDRNRNGDEDLLEDIKKMQEIQVQDECEDKGAEETVEVKEGGLQRSEQEPTTQPLQEDTLISEETPPLPAKTQREQLTNEPTEDLDLSGISREIAVDPAENLQEKPGANGQTIDGQETRKEKKDQHSEEPPEEDLPNEQVTQSQEGTDEQKTPKEKKDQRGEEPKNTKPGLDKGGIPEEDLPNEQVTQSQEGTDEQKTPKEKQDQRGEEPKNTKLGLEKGGIPEQVTQSQEGTDEQKTPKEKQDQRREEPKNTKLGLDKGGIPEEDLPNEQVTQSEGDTEEEKTPKEKQDQRGEEPKNTKLGLDKGGIPEEDLPNEQVTQFLRHLVAQLWPELGPNPGLHLERASAKGDNYLGVVWRLQVQATAIDSESKCSLVVKLPPQNRVRRKQFFARPCFLRETAAYEDFLPLAAELQEKWQIPAEDRFLQHARCYGTRQDEPNECIVLEDLSCSGFELHNRFVDLPEDHVRHVIRSYAKLHALSLAGKRQCPERMQRLQQLVDIFEQRREDHALGVYFENLKGSALSSLAEADDPYRARLEGYFSRGSYFELLLPLVNGFNCEPFAVICHGDCWNNNILYQRGGGGEGELRDVRLIDWQLMRYASPITDLAYFLFTCTSRDFRQRHLNRVLDEYYEELGHHLTRLGEQVEQLMPRSAFEQQVATRAAVGLLLAMMVLPIVTMQGQDVPDLQAISERIEAGATTDLRGAGFLGAGNEATFKQRMREVILDCVDFNYI